MQYVVYEFATQDEIERSWLISLLGDCHFDGFEEATSVLKAYAPAELVTTEGVQQLLTDNEFTHIAFTHYLLEDKNWNEEWEKNFDPVTVIGRVGIRAPFHAPLNTEMELVIEPKMSFGTGHHATTASVIEMMMRMDFTGKSVLDFGSGTGVLAILAEKLKAAKIIAIDNEEWAFGNCIENIERNGCSCITPILGDDSYRFNEKFDILLANINRHVILKNLAFWKTLLAENGKLVVSGILLSDEKDVIEEAAKNGLVCRDIIRNEGWLAILFDGNE